MKKALAALVILIVLGAAALGGGYYWLTEIYANRPVIIMPQRGTVSADPIVIIEPGTGGQKIAQMLEGSRVIRFSKAFRALSLLTGKASRFKAGEYQFASGMTPLQVMEKLVKGDVVQHRITFREGLTVAEIMATLNQDPVLRDEGVTPPPAEGTLLPESYHFVRGTTRAELLSRMLKAQQAVLNRLWPERAEGLPFTTPQEALTLASIIEKETGVADERERVAAVYINRLKIGMPLQADPTVSYGLHGGQSNAPALTLADLKTEHSYNTYMVKGLPPGPICNPGEKSIHAALHPAQTKDLFFVATGTGGHYFAETLEQHNENVKKYRLWQKTQN